MKKSLLAVAIAALPAVSFAQSNVTLYGIADAGITSVNNGNDSALRIDSGIMSTSRWGLRGSEDLGGGLKGIFNLESGVRVDVGTPALDFTRRAVVGLGGGFGEVRLGRDYTPAFLAAGGWDALGYGLYGNTLNYTAIASGTAVRFSNGIFYDSPSFGGLKVSAGFGLGEVPGDGGQGRGLSLAGTYGAGPLSAGLYYETQNSLGAKNAALVKINRMGLGGGYNFGAFRLVGGFQRTSGDPAKQTFINLGGAINLGAGSLLAQFSRHTIDVAAGTDPKTNTFGLAYTYPMSKRTTLYATIGQASNNATGVGVLRSSDNSIGGVADKSARGIGLGVRHSF